jgi:hypothetical protein
MHRQPSFAPEFPLGLRRVDLKTSLIGWGAYIALLTGYCCLYDPIVTGEPADVPGTFFYVLREWAVWWFLTPLALKALRQNELEQRRWRVSYVQVGVAALLISVAFRVAVDLLTEARGTAAVVFIYMPRYLAVSIVLVLFWHFFLRQERPVRPQGTRAAVGDDRHDRQSSSEPAVDVHAGEHAEAQTQTTESVEPAYPASLLVNSGGDSWPLPLERVDFITPAGKNVEIRSGNRDYVMRASMKELQDTLPPSQFVRVHRSYIVNIHEIDRVSASRSGNDSIVLRCGRRINVGKKYRSQFLDSVTRTLLSASDNSQ